MASQNERAFRRWWWLLVLTVVLGIGGALVSLQVVKPQYQASCKLFVAGRPDTGTGEGYQAAQFAQARVAAYLDLVKGARVSEGAINALGIGMSTADLQGRVTASAAAESVIMTVSVVDEGPQRSADLVNAVCLSFLSVVADAEGANPLVNVRIIEYAKAPEYAVGPSKSRFLVVGTLAGLLAGIGLIMTMGRMGLKDEQASKVSPSVEDATAASQAPTRQGPEDPSGAGFHRRYGE